jgi:hypothetical protein
MSDKPRTDGFGTVWYEVVKSVQQPRQEKIDELHLPVYEEADELIGEYHWMQ